MTAHEENETYVTRESLLIRLQDAEDSLAWDQFYETYRAFIFNFARHRGCSEEMAQDVLQESLMTINRVMPSFTYDRKKGRFRSFLLTIVKSRIVDAFRREQKQSRLNETELDQDANAVPDRWHQEWEDDWNREWERHLLMRALDRVKVKIQPHVFESFQLYVLERRSAREVTEKLGIPEANIYNQRRRVMQMLQREIAELRSELGD